MRDLIASSDGELDERLVGGKLSRQRIMAARGLRVPTFFCLTIRFYEKVLARIEGDVRRALDAVDFADPNSIRAASERIGELFREASLEPAEERAILDAFDRTFSAGDRVAVRASTVGRVAAESEDSLANPFAGMSETFLFVPRAALLDHVRRTWASGFSEQSIVYRHAQGFDLLGFGVAVGVQAMITAARSFLLFTSNPKTAIRETVIAAGFGAGEGIVQERVGVDHFFVKRAGKSPSGAEIRRQLGKKDARLVLDESAGVGLRALPTPAESHDPPCLSDAEVERLVSLGERIEGIFGLPQDIEGCFDEKGELFVLQARPIAFDYAAMRVWTNANVTESFPGATTPLTFTFARFFYRVIFYDCYRRLGISPRGLHENFEPLDHMIGFLGGRVYYNLSAFYHLHSQSPLFPLFRGHWEKMMGFRSSYQTRAPGVFARAWDFTWHAMRFGSALVVVLFRFFTHDGAMARFFAWWDGLIAPLRGTNLSSRSPLAIIDEFRRVWVEVGREWGVTLLNDTYLPMLYGITEKLFARWKLTEDPSLLSDLLCGDEEILSVEIVYSSVRLAERVRAVPALAEAFANEDAETLWSKLERGELDADFTRAVREHLARYGDRGLMELKIEQPNLRDDPASLLRAVAGYVRAGVSERAMREAERETRKKAEARLRDRLGWSPLRRVVLRILLGYVRGLIRYRENSRYRRSELFGFSKNVFRALGRHLVARGAVVRAEDVVLLTQDEIFGWFDGTGVTNDLALLIDVRRAELAKHEAIETPIEITTLGAVRDHAIEQPTAPVAGGNTLSGLGSSSGRVRGHARVVLDPRAVAKLPADAILVAKETDPGWLFLMLAAKGIVVERGSMLSHTAITGRKFGIPTVVSVSDATRRIPEGAFVEVDGAAGTVTLLDESAS